MRIPTFCRELIEAEQVPEEPVASGVYVILNRVTMRAYIGKSKNIAQRCANHRRDLRENRHHNNRLQDEWNAYGGGVFVFAPYALADVDEATALEEALITESAGEDCYNYPSMAERRQGRKPLSPSGELMRSRPIRMTDEQWSKFKRLGGPGWLRDRIDRAKEKNEG